MQQYCKVEKAKQTKRLSPALQAPIRFDDILIYPVGHCVFRHAQEVILTPKEYALLLALVQNANKVLSREELLAEVWGYDSFGHPRTIDVHIQRLRKKLGLQQRIHTIPKVGYCFRSDAFLHEGGHV